MVNIASYKFYFIGGVIIALTIVVGGDIPNFVFKVWVLALLFSLLTLIYYVNKLAAFIYYENSKYSIRKTNKIENCKTKRKNQFSIDYSKDGVKYV